MPRRRTTWDEAASPQTNARRRLPAMLAKYVETGRKLLEGNPPPEQLHALRLETKRVRYTLELFASCYGPGLEPRMALLRRIQQRLGDVNDCHASRALAAAKLPARSPYLARIARFLDARAAGEVEELRREWQAAFATSEQTQVWIAYLSRARPSRRKRSGHASR